MWVPGDRIFEKEAKLEEAAGDLAKKHGWWHRKYKHPGRRAAPDRIFARNGHVFWVEFKRQLCEPTEQQWIEMGEMRDAGLDVVWIDSIEDFVAVLNHRENIRSHYQQTA